MSLLTKNKGFQCIKVCLIWVSYTKDITIWCFIDTWHGNLDMRLMLRWWIFWAPTCTTCGRFGVFFWGWLLINPQRLKIIWPKIILNNLMQFVSSRKHINVSYDRSNYTDESFVKSKLFTQICCVIHVSKLLNMCMLIPCIDDYLDKNVLLNFERLNEHCLP